MTPDEDDRGHVWRWASDGSARVFCEECHAEWLPGTNGSGACRGESTEETS